MGGRGNMELHGYASAERRTSPAGSVRARLVRRSSVVGLLGASALLFAACNGGPTHPAAAPVHQKAGPVVKTDPVTTVSAPSTTTTTTTTTTTAPAVKTAPNTFVPPSQPTPAATPATPPAPPAPAACVWSNFATKVTTDQGSYAPGQPVQITLEFANAGPACTVNATGYGCPRVNISNSAGTLVWSNAAPTTTGCPSAFTGPKLIPASWTQSSVITWGQDTCTPGQASCPGAQVPAGQYQVVGLDAGGSSQIPASTPVAVTLNA